MQRRISWNCKVCVCVCWHVRVVILIVSRQSCLSYFPLFSWPAHTHCAQLDPRSCLTFQRGIWHQWKLGLFCYYLCLQILPHKRQSSLSYFPLFSWPAHTHCTQLDPRSCLTFQRGIWHQWKLGLFCYYLCLQILQHFVAVSIACCGKARIFDCMNIGVFISPVSSFLKPVIHFRDSAL